jgi:predicted small metal-binding protein
MALTVTCECGVTVRGETDDEFVAKVQQHAKEAHKMEVSREQALSMAQPVGGSR